MVGAIVPWNFPLMFTSWKLGPALAAGNTVVMKPSEIVPLSTLRLCELMVEVGLPPGVVNVVPGYGHDAGARLAAHPGVGQGELHRLDPHRAVGRRGVGREPQAAAARARRQGRQRRVRRRRPRAAVNGVGLRDLPQPGPGVHRRVAACCCTTPIADEFLERFLALAALDPGGRSAGPGTEMGPLTSPEHRDRVLSYVKVAEDEGGEVLLGGAAPSDPALAAGCYVLPTVVRADPSARVCQEEVFGPFVTVSHVRLRRRGPRPGQRHRLRARRQPVDPRPVPRPPHGRRVPRRDGVDQLHQAGRAPARRSAVSGSRATAARWASRRCGATPSPSRSGSTSTPPSPPGTRGADVAAVTTLAEAVADLVHDGDIVALEGFTHLIPYAAGHEIIRQGRADLTLVRLTPDVVYDQMIGMGCARKLVFSWGGNPGVGSLHRFRDAVENGWPRAARARGAQPRRHGQPLRGRGVGPAVRACCAATTAPTSSATPTTWPPIACPFTGEELTAVAALQPDVAIIHAQRADRAGQRAALGHHRRAEGGRAGGPAVDRHRRGGRRRARRPARRRRAAVVGGHRGGRGAGRRCAELRPRLLGARRRGLRGVGRHQPRPRPAFLAWMQDHVLDLVPTGS